MAFAILVLAIIFVFGHLIAGSLSQRYLEDLLLNSRQDAQRIAEQLEDGEVLAVDLEGVSRTREELFRTLDGVAQRRMVEFVEVFDKDGDLIFTSEFTSTEVIPEGEIDHLAIKGGISDRQVTEIENPFRIVEPIGQVGQVVLHLSRNQLGERVSRLRRELLGRTVVAAGLTFLTLVVAFGLIWVLIQRNRKLEARNRHEREMATLGTLAANLAHEIRNPLNSINLNLELVEEDLQSEIAENAAVSLADTRNEVNRLGRLVSDFLTYARPSDVMFEDVDLVDLVIGVRDFLAAESLERGVGLRLKAASEEIIVKGDPGQLRQVLMNLVLNGVQAVERLDTDRRLVNLTVERSENQAEVAVRDLGDGVPEEELDRIRDAFFTKKRGGSGLGLAIAERVIVAHNGRLVLENLNPPGFEARVILPLSMEDGKMSRSTVAIGP
ncbi:MAG: GHKL domain-containing protein [Acidobacteria bacterium]|nr:GHKL domain-containing protein [Acidobacteriota bacterium]